MKKSNKDNFFNISPPSLLWHLNVHWMIKLLREVYKSAWYFVIILFDLNELSSVSAHSLVHYSKNLSANSFGYSLFYLSAISVWSGFSFIQKLCTRILVPAKTISLRLYYRIYTRNKRQSVTLLFDKIVNTETMSFFLLCILWPNRYQFLIKSL